MTESLRYGAATVGGGVSVGEHFEAGGSAEATFHNGVAVVKVGGDVAALVGLEVDVGVAVDTNASVHDGKVVTKVAEDKSKTVAKVAVEESKVVAKVATSATNTVVSTTKKVTNSISRGFKKAFRI